MPKRSRLVRKISGPDFECIQKPCPKDDHLNTGRFGIWMLTVLIQACPLTHLSSFQMVNQNQPIYNKTVQASSQKFLDKFVSGKQIIGYLNTGPVFKWPTICLPDTNLSGFLMFPVDLDYNKNLNTRINYTEIKRIRILNVRFFNSQSNLQSTFEYQICLVFKWSKSTFIVVQLYQSSFEQLPEFHRQLKK